MTRDISRRQMISIVAGAGSCLLPGASVFAASPRLPQPVTWRGVALGAPTQITLYHDDKQVAGGILDKCRQEISRLENLFSLYRADSQISQLNRNGRLANPHFDLLELLAASTMIARETSGAFDITVQPLWQLYSNHFSKPGADPLGPPNASIRAAVSAIDYKRIDLSPQMVRLGSQAMAITLNGIAQGFITDRIAKLLKSSGWPDVLISIGEIYAAGTKPGARPWLAAIADPTGASATVKTVTLKDRALATSGGYGTLFSRDGAHHHLFDPATGRSTRHYKSVSVMAPSATLADGLSTAFSAMKNEDIKNVLERFDDISVIIVGNDDRLIEL